MLDYDGARPITLKARWVFPVVSAPIANGRVTIRDGRIEAVGGTETQADIDLGNVALLPGFVNAHTHLDLTGMRAHAVGRIANPPYQGDFVGWLRGVVAQRRQRSAEQVQADIAVGLAECLRCGTTLIGDIAAGGSSWPTLSRAPVRAVVFHELLGLSEKRAETAWGEAEQWLRAHPSTETCRAGLSPHAPYSVRASLFGRAGALSRHDVLPLATHLGESSAEVELLTRRAGPFVDFLKEMSVWDPDDLAATFAEVIDLSGPDAIIVHANFVEPALLSGGNVVECPRTRAAFAHAVDPLGPLLEQGARVALGTDSLASNPDLDILAEARFVHDRHPAIAGATLLRMLTLNGAEMLGLGDVTGSLEAGKSADLVVLPLPDAEPDDPHDLVFDSTLPVREVLFRGTAPGGKVP